MKDMTQGSVTRHLLHMASVIAVSMLVQTLYLLADLYWVARLGKEAIAAVGCMSRLAGFDIKHVWYLSVATILFQAGANLLLLRREFQKKLTFSGADNLASISGSATPA